MFSNLIESDFTGVYDGTMDANTFEITPPGESVTSRLIRTDQHWGVRVQWEIHGPLAIFLDEEFRVTIYGESLSKDSDDFTQPVAGFLAVGTLTGALSFPGGVATRNYDVNINIAPGAVNPSIYKLTTSLQLFDSASNKPYPVACFVEGVTVQLYTP